MSKDSKNTEAYQMPYDLSHLAQHGEDPNSSLASRSARDAMGPTAKRLYDKARIPAVITDLCTDTDFFKKGITTVAKAEDHFAFLEDIYKVYQINLMGASKEYLRLTMDFIVEYVNRDPLGTRDKPGLDDTVYWSDGKRTEQAVYPDDFHEKKKRGKPYLKVSATKI